MDKWVNRRTDRHIGGLIVGLLVDLSLDGCMHRWAEDRWVGACINGKVGGWVS